MTLPELDNKGIFFTVGQPGRSICGVYTGWQECLIIVEKANPCSFVPEETPMENILLMV